MSTPIRIQMMGTFRICVNGAAAEALEQKSVEGAGLLQYLIVHRDDAADREKIIREVFRNSENKNPDNALRTLVSRLRAFLREMAPGFDKCIAAEQSSYRWNDLPEVSVDLFELEELFEALSEDQIPVQKQEQICERILALYAGDLLQDASDVPWAMEKAIILHNKYLYAVNDYISCLKAGGKDAAVISVCRKSLAVTPFDERFHCELINALLRENRVSEAISQYVYYEEITRRIFGTEPGSRVKEAIRAVMGSGAESKEVLDSFASELRSSLDKKGAFLCDRNTFLQTGSLLMNNMKRLRRTLLLGTLSLIPEGAEKTGGAEMARQTELLKNILCDKLRSGDVVTQLPRHGFAVLLPTADYESGKMIMQRIQDAYFHQKEGAWKLYYCISPLLEKDSMKEFLAHPSMADGEP